MNDAEVEAMWRAGSVRGWVRGLIAVAWLLALMIAVVGGRVIWRTAYPRHGHDETGVCSALAIVVTLGLAIALAIPMRGSRWIRAAVALPFVQAIALVTAWLLWSAGDPDLLPLAHRFPPAMVVAVVALVYAGVAALVARPHERLHAGVMLALANLLALGLWAPIATRLWCGGDLDRSYFGYDWVRRDLVGLGVVLLAPPFLAASAFTAFHFRQHRMPKVILVVATVIVAAVGASIGRLAVQDYAVGQFAHVMLAITLVAVGAIGVLAAAMAIDAARARTRLVRGLVGTVHCAEPFAAALTIGSWLRGPQQVLGRFTIVTEHGELPVPGGARWHGPVPESTSLLDANAATVVLRDGDTVHVSGFTEVAQTDPFRTARAWMPRDEVWVSRIQDTLAPTNIGLALWRPCVAFLAIAIAVGIPGLVAALCAM